MKKILVSLFAVVAIAAVACGSAFAAGDSYTVSAGTYAVTDAAYIGAQISGAAKIDKLIISVDTAAAETVTVYELGASTTTVTAVAVFALPAAIGTYVFDFPGFNPLKITDFCVRKSSTGATVNVTAVYR
jgi:hypothetical protein